MIASACDPVCLFPHVPERPPVCSVGAGGKDAGSSGSTLFIRLIEADGLRGVVAVLWGRILASDHSSLRLPLYFIAMRNRWDFFQTAIVGRPTYYIGWLSVWLSVFGFLSAPVTGSVGDVLGVFTLLSGTGTALFEFARSRIRPSEVRLYDVAPTFHRLDVGDGRLVRFPRLTGISDPSLRLLAQRRRNEVAVVWPSVDSNLPAAQVSFSLSRAKVPLPAELRKDNLSRAILSRRYKGRARNIYNGRVVRQDSDLDVAAVRHGHVQLSVTRYFAVAVTNYLTTSQVVDADDRVVLDGPSLIQDERGRLKTLAASRLANGIGVSTIALTTDGHLLLARQSETALSSGGRWAPSGSGSVDLRDVVKGCRWNPAERADFLHLLRSAMARELVEECHLSPAAIEWTSILGYFRWLDKGAKPEYLGVTKLAMSSEDLQGRHPRLVERRYVDAIATCPVDLVGLAADPDGPTCLRTESFRVHMSMPLYLCLRALGNRLAVDDDFRRSLST